MALLEVWNFPIEHNTMQHLSVKKGVSGGSLWLLKGQLMVGEFASVTTADLGISQLTDN